MKTTKKKKNGARTSGERQTKEIQQKRPMRRFVLMMMLNSLIAPHQIKGEWPLISIVFLQSGSYYRKAQAALSAPPY